MAHEVFISYASQNRDAADLVCAYLEHHGISCWIAPRNVPSGSFLAPIVEAVRSSRVLVLVFSSHANLSRYVLGEVLQAFDHQITIIPFRMEDVPFSPDLDLILRGTHWVDALPPPVEERLEDLCGRLNPLVAGTARVVVRLPSILDYDTTSILAKRAGQLAERGEIVSFLIAAAIGQSRRADPTERYWAYIALGEIGSEEALVAVRNGLDNEDNDFARRGAADALNISLDG